MSSPFRLPLALARPDSRDHHLTSMLLSVFEEMQQFDQGGADSSHPISFCCGEAIRGGARRHLAEQTDRNISKYKLFVLVICVDWLPMLWKRLVRIIAPYCTRKECTYGNENSIAQSDTFESTICPMMLYNIHKSTEYVNDKTPK